jgi:hypothetical protein
MVKYLLVGLAVFLAVLAAFYSGLFIGRSKPGPPPGLPPPPSADYWNYPGSKELKRSGGEESLLAVLTTPDDFDEVARFYHQQISKATGLSAGPFDPQTVGIGSAGYAWGSYCYASDSTRPEGGPRKVRSLVFEVRSRSFDLTVFVDRAEGEGHTHVTLTYDPKPNAEP